MITRRAVVGLGLAGLSLAACGQDEEGAGPRLPGEVRFSILSTEAAPNGTRDWAPILADMAAQTGLSVKPFFSANASLLIEAMRSKRNDFGWFSDLSGLEAVRRADGEVFARAFDPAGADGYNSLLIVNAMSKLTLAQVLKCNRTLTFGLGEALSTSGALAPMTYLFAPRDINPATCFRKVRGGASHQSNLTAVAAGQLDVATSNSTFLNKARRDGGREADQVRVIWTSPTLPDDPIIWRRDLDPAVKEKLRQFFLTYGQGEGPLAARQRLSMARIDIGGFRPADDSFLLPVREMEATRAWLLAKQGHDAARTAAARKTLDSITAQRMALEARTRTPAAAQ